MSFQQRMARRNDAVRAAFGLIWAIDASFKWSPAFGREYLSILRDAAKGQPAWLHP